jgi:hypothetical protein
MFKLPVILAAFCLRENLSLNDAGRKYSKCRKKEFTGDKTKLTGDKTKFTGDKTNLTSETDFHTGEKMN